MSVVVSTEMFPIFRMVGGVRLRYRGSQVTPHNLSSYLHSDQLGHHQPLPRQLQDQVVLSSVCCRRDERFSSIAPDLTAAHINPEPPLYSVKFCPVSGHHHLLALANEDGRIAVQDTSRVSPSQDAMPGLSCHDNAIFDLAWSRVTASSLVTVSGDQKVRVWDLGQADTLRQLREFSGHSRSVKCVEWRPGGGSQFATGSRDNSIMLWDTRDSSTTVPCNAIRVAHSPPLSQLHVKKKKREQAGPGSGGRVTGLTWLDENTLVSAGDMDGVVKVWDLRKNYCAYKRDPLPRLQIYHPGDSSTVGYTALCPTPCRNYLYVSCMDDKIYKYDMVNAFQTPSAVYTGASIKDFFIKMCVSPCGRYIASGSADNWAYLWNTSSPGGPTARLGPSDAEVTCLDWSHDSLGNLATLVTASDDMKHQVWRPHTAKLPPEEVWAALELLDKKEEVMVVNRALETPRRCSAVTPRTGGKKQTPSIKTFLTPSNSKKGGTTPVNEEKRGLKRRKSIFSDENSPDRSSCRNLSASISSLLSSPSSKCSFTPETYRSPTKKVVSSPMKSSISTPRRIASPLKLFSPLREIKQLQSPTANLPNLVEDGTSPRATFKRGKLERSGSNWLTAYAKEKKLEGSSKSKAAVSGLPKTSGLSKVNAKKPKKI